MDRVLLKIYFLLIVANEKSWKILMNMTQRKRISLDDIPDRGKGNYTGKVSFVTEKEHEEALEQVSRIGKNKADFCRLALKNALEEAGLLPVKAS